MGLPGTGLRLKRVESRVFGEGRPFLPESASPLLKNYIHDLTGLYGMTHRRDFLTTTRNSYAEMAGEILSAMAPLPGPVGLVAVATATPDADMLQSPTALLAHAVPGAPLPLGVTDQGVVAPFTALRLIGEFAGTGHALLVIMDQRSLPYETGAAERPAEDCAVAVLLGGGQTGHTGQIGDADAPDDADTPDDADDADDLFLVRRIDVAPGDVRPALAAELAGRERDVTVIARPGLDLPDGLADVRFAPPGRPCTGIWATLADGLAGWRSTGRRVVLADYDSTLRYLSLCTVEVGRRERAEA
ncbi:hypothetical protein [Streptosporangium sp. NPDC006007]|uniref:hypothetical protein n=1 Tax=Streptosporangium sp. NPDC006007 TaxID=3154575 RepID=UPI0033AFB5D4